MNECGLVLQGTEGVERDMGLSLQIYAQECVQKLTEPRCRPYVPVPTLSGTMSLTHTFPIPSPQVPLPLQEARLPSSRVLDPSWLIGVPSPRCLLKMRPNTDICIATRCYLSYGHRDTFFMPLLAVVCVTLHLYIYIYL